MSEFNTEKYIEELVTRYETLRSQCDSLEDDLKMLKAEKTTAEAQVISAILGLAEATGADDLTVRVGAYKYGATVKEYYRIPKAARDEAFPLLRELGLGDLITEQVNDKTLSSELAGVLEDNGGEELPPEYEPLLAHLERYSKPSLSRRKA